MNAMTERTWARDIYAARTIPHPPAMPRTFTHCAGVPWTDQEDWGTYDGIFAMASPPVRANTPQAGTDGYEPEARLPVDWADLLGTLAGFVVIALFWGTIIYRFARGVWPWQ